MRHKSMTWYALINKKPKNTYKLKYVQLASKSRRREQIQAASLMVLENKTIIRGLDKYSATQEKLNEQ